MKLLLLLLPSCVALKAQLRRPLAPGSRLHPLKNAAANNDGPPGSPNVIIYPGKGWGLSKPPPKRSLYPDANPNDPVDTAWSAKVWILNLIQFVHWASFPIGFALFWKLFSNASSLGQKINPNEPSLGIFFILMAHVCQVFGGGISGNMMHQYEGWQVAVFRNPLEPYGKEAEPGYNDAWLRAVAYQMLFSFQVMGVFFTSIGVFGVERPAMKALAALTGIVISLAPQLPHCTTVFPWLFEKIGLTKPWKWLTKGRPVFPLSIWLFATFMINTFAAVMAYEKMFSGINWVGVPILENLPREVAAIIPFGLVGFGGIYEGLVAETRFNQWHHFLAFILLDLGLFLHIPYYMRLIA